MSDAPVGGGERGEDEEVRTLFERMPGDAAAREELITRFTPLAEYLARRFGGRGQPVEDLVQVAYVGLIGAVDRFDPSRGVRFTTFASATIVGELKRHLRDKAWAVRVPRSMQELALRINRTIPSLTQELGRAPTVRELADRLGSSTEEVVAAMDASQAFSAGSLDAPIGEGGATSHDVLGSEDEALERLDEWASVAPAVKELPERERRVLYLRFFEGMTQSQIAEVIGVSQMHVSRILAQVLARLRQDSGV